jgi:hypothetical protein
MKANEFIRIVLSGRGGVYQVAILYIVTME